MLLIGLLALLQMLWLPGVLLRRAFVVEEPDLIGRACVTVGLSLIANTVLVAALVTLGVYTRWVMAAVILAEAAVAVAWAVRDRRTAAEPAEHAPWRALLADRTFAGTVGLLLSLATVAILLHLCWTNWGTVFSETDDVLNWDRWAREWAAGGFPQRGSWYPQLLPANWSITYVLLGRTDIKMFAKATTTVFPLLAVGLFFSLAVRRLDRAFLLGAFLGGWVYLHDLGPAFLQIGYADVPLAFFGLLTFYVVRRESWPAPRDAILLSLVMAAGTILTKQGGVFALAAAAIFAAWAWPRRAESGPSAWRSPAALVACAAIGFAAAWYGRKWYQIHIGADASNLGILTQALHQGRTYPQRLVFAAKLAWDIRGPDVALLQVPIALLLAGSLFLRETRWITLLLIAPFLLGWGLWFSYELRNAALAFPFVAFVGGVVLERWLSRVAAPLDRLRVGRTTAGALVAAVVLLAAATWAWNGQPSLPAVAPAWIVRLARNAWTVEALHLYTPPILAVALGSLVFQAANPDLAPLRFWRPAVLALSACAVVMAARGSYADAALAARQLEQRQRIGLPSVDARLYAFFADARARAPVLSDYMFIRELPGLEPLFRRMPRGADYSYEGLKALAAGNPDVGYLMLYDAHLDDATRLRLASSPIFRTVVAESNFRLLAIDRAALKDGASLVRQAR